MPHNILENIKMLKNILQNTEHAIQHTGEHKNLQHNILENVTHATQHTGEHKNAKEHTVEHKTCNTTYWRK
jgi:hypothetical protein